MSETVYVDTSRLERRIDLLSSQIQSMDQTLDQVSGSVDRVQNDLRALREQFEQMRNDQKKAASLQRAATELVRVRQEIEQNFGNYRIIRETMLGTLQATDLALVKKTTIERVSEELMLSTPKYWLAPCLVAVAAWIGNDRDLANRAIAEAVKRDEERTALTMALICRRNNRTDACHEWLALYFSNQNAAHFSEGSFVYIDAYINGVFGVDSMHLCDDYVGRWLSEIKGSSVNFEKNQNDTWRNYCAGFTCGLGNKYAELSQHAAEYGQIAPYVERVNAAEAVISSFSDAMAAEVNQGVLKEQIDRNLIELISRYNDDEQPLRREEAYLQAVKRYDGNEEAARAEIMEREKRRMNKAKNIVEQMMEAITDDTETSVSQRKTALSFLGGYISKGITEFVAEKKEAFPNIVTLSVNGWTGTTRDGNNGGELLSSYAAHNEAQRAAEVQAVAATKPTKYLAGLIGCGAVAIIMLFLTVFLAIPFLGGAGFFAYKFLTFGKVKEKKIAQIHEKYNALGADGQQRIIACLAQWQEIQQHTAQFESKPIHIA